MNHDWLWALNPVHGPVVPPVDFATCVQVRLEAHFAGEPVTCSRCGVVLVERTAAHGLCCAAPKATRRHYRARNAILALVHLADPTATVEEPELIPEAPALRPADIFTSSGLPGGQAALDIGICSPDETGAGEDCCQQMVENKTGTYGEFHEGMARRGLRYVPVVLLLRTRAFRFCRRAGASRQPGWQAARCL